MTLRIPSEAECLELMNHYGMLPNIRQHSLVVARVAGHIVKGIAGRARIEPGEEATALVHAGALLHDIAKTLCLRQECKHAVLGGTICRDHGFAEVAEIVEEHVRLRRHEPERFRQGTFTASEIVYYADKRVRHDEVVDLTARRDYILARYGGNDPVRCVLISENFARCLELEQALFRFLPFAPSALNSPGSLGPGAEPTAE